jgi:uncharacterized BrkB/YihY/UPF0761 family membrane protein
MVRMGTYRRAAGAAVERLARVAERALRAYFAGNCPKFAAAISFHVLFALFPTAILVVAASGFLLDDPGTRADLLSALLDRLPLSESGQRDLEELLDGVASPRSALGFIAVPVLLWTASGMMSAIRIALNQAWPVREPRPASRSPPSGSPSLCASRPVRSSGWRTRSDRQVWTRSAFCSRLCWPS